MGLGSLFSSSSSKSSTSNTYNTTTVAETGLQLDGESLGLGIGNSSGLDIDISTLDGGAIESAFNFAEQAFQDSLVGASNLFNPAVEAVRESNASVLAAKDAETDTIVKIVTIIALAIALVFGFRFFAKG